MKPFIQPYHYNFLAEHSLNLLKTNQWVNDQGTRGTLRSLIIEKIHETFPDSSLTELALLEEILLIEKSHKEVQAYLEKLTPLIIPFKAPTDSELKKLFKKTKKLKLPDWQAFPLTDFSFYGWNDPGQQRKYLIYYENDQLIGIDGVVSPTVKTSICSICHTKSPVTLFMARVRGGHDGTYLNQGNYICYDSHQCNKQIQRRTELEAFMANVKYQK